MPIRAVSFDLFDTLVDLRMERLPTYQIGGRTHFGTQGALHAEAVEFVEIDLEGFVGALRDTDRAFRETRYAEGRELPTLERFAALAERLGAPEPAFAERLTETHMAALRGQAVFVPHHEEVLRELGRALGLGLCSNFSHTPTALRLLEEAGLAEHLPVRAISDEVGLRKPRPEIFERLLERLGLPAADVLHVGDRLDADVAGAAAIGMATAWLTRRVADPEDARAAYGGPAPDHVIGDLGEIGDLLRSARSPGA